MKAAVGGIVHESSTFATQVIGTVTAGDFTVLTGPAMVAEFAGTNTGVGGYLDACAEEGVAVVPALHARAEPGGAVEPAAYRELEERFLAELDTGCELVLLDLDGAGVVAPDLSLEVLLVRAVRAAVRPGTAIAVTMDLHGNIPAELTELADVTVGYHDYPHTDMAARARTAARIAVAAARGRVRPRTRRLRVPMALPPSPTDGGPALELRHLVKSAEQEPGVLACTVFHGFPYADTPQAATTVVTVTDEAVRLGDAVNDQIAAWLWRHRARFLVGTLSPEHAVEQAADGYSLVVADASDDPGGGGSGDGTYLLRAIRNRGIRACFATLYDPAAVARATEAGVGAVADFELGGRHGKTSGEPLRVRAKVRAITDGRVSHADVRRGRYADFGRSVRLSADGLELIVASRRLPVLDPEIFLLHGVLPERFPLVGVKAAHHFKSGFAHLGARLVTADAPGLTSRRIAELPRTGPSAALWPMNRTAVFHRPSATHRPE